MEKRIFSYQRISTFKFIPIITKTIEWPIEPSFDQISELITPLLETDNFEHIIVLHNNKRCDMFVDEIGLLKKLPRNTRATGIYRNAALTLKPNIDPEKLPCIVGPAVLFLDRCWF